MSWLLAAALLVGSPPDVELPASRSLAAEAWPTELQTGSLIFSRGDCLAVRVYTLSPYTHVGAIVMRQGEPFVYDSMNGVGVRRLALREYLEHQQPTEIHLFHPQQPFSKERGGEFERYLESQLGRSYAVRHHLTGEAVDGMHCAEYVTSGLIRCGVLQAKEPARVSPASLVEGIVKANVYRQAETIELKPEAVAAPANASWCSRSWHCTKQCTYGCYAQMRRWFCCK
jgi:hypothetical protein